MGKLVYNDQVKVDIEDRAMAHLQIVIGNKLRRGEPFFFSWKEDVSVGSGRSTVWLHPSCGLHFKYHGGRPPKLNRAWLDALAFAANQPTGLYLVPEPAAVFDGEPEAELIG